MMEIIIAIAMIMGAFCYYQNNKIVITNLKVKSRINKSLRIAQISDLHSKSLEEIIILYIKLLWNRNLILL